jgi:hypothetical protein
VCVCVQDGDFDSAYATLFDAFQYFQNVGSDTRVPCLKYMLIANMLKEVSCRGGVAAQNGNTSAHTDTHARAHRLRRVRQSPQRTVRLDQLRSRPRSTHLTVRMWPT